MQTFLAANKKKKIPGDPGNPTASQLSETPSICKSDAGLQRPNGLIPINNLMTGISPALAADIGKPDFKLEVSQDKKKTTLYVQDPLTALFKDGRQLNMRDVYADQLKYRVTYRRNKSTGKVRDRQTDGRHSQDRGIKRCFPLQKTKNFDSSVIELSDLDAGESYCFYVQAYIPSRSPDKQLGEQSSTQCSNDNKTSIFDGEEINLALIESCDNQPHRWFMPLLP